MKRISLNYEVYVLTRSKNRTNITLTLVACEIGNNGKTSNRVLNNQILPSLCWKCMPFCPNLEIQFYVKRQALGRNLEALANIPHIGLVWTHTISCTCPNNGNNHNRHHTQKTSWTGVVCVGNGRGLQRKKDHLTAIHLPRPHLTVRIVIHHSWPHFLRPTYQKTHFPPRLALVRYGIKDTRLLFKGTEDLSETYMEIVTTVQYILCK